MRFREPQAQKDRVINRRENHLDHGLRCLFAAKKEEENSCS